MDTIAGYLGQTEIGKRIRIKQLRSISIMTLTKNET